MPPRPHRPAALAWQVFRGTDAVRQSLLTEHQLRSSAWVRLRHDVYADSRLDRDHALSCRAAALRLPAGVLIAGPSAVYLHGVAHAAAFDDEVHILVPRSMRVGAQRGLRVHVGDLDLPVAQPSPPSAWARGTTQLDGSPPGVPGSPDRAATHSPSRSANAPGSRPAGRPDTRSVSRSDERPDTRSVNGFDGPSARPPGGGSGDGPGRSRATLEVVRGRRPTTSVITTARPGWAGATGPHPVGPLPRTGPAQAAWETAVWLEPVRAVGIVDALLREGLTSRDGLAAIADAYGGRPGGRRARWVFDLADPGAQSPPESHLRVRLVLAGLPRPVAQHPVRLPGGLVLHPDLAWPNYRVAVEYDGQRHADPERLHLDRKRLNHLVAAGWLMLHVTSRRLHQDFPGVLREVRAALAARGRRL
ncbi:hypothetical protein ACFOOK_19425 [Micromonospora krabiensis]|uniref:Very-short-patch-repair endonuclease n=1 Tax=Micromonospora krabiensis TaxID=307121 RepID=A0A1C3N9I9_9ACTN|nr:hypothetical protein [Micromonospora krabiensis]SBV29255.1 Very-short-patch-repair endonuclease [Micromonospora krabiensis]